MLINNDSVADKSGTMLGGIQHTWSSVPNNNNIKKNSQ